MADLKSLRVGVIFDNEGSKGPYRTVSFGKGKPSLFANKSQNVAKNLTFWSIVVSEKNIEGAVDMFRDLVRTLEKQMEEWETEGLVEEGVDPEDLPF